MNKKENEMREQEREEIIERLQAYNGYYSELHHEVFNTDYYIIGTYLAKEALKEYDVFEATEKLINMLYYIIGEEVLNIMMENIEEFQDNWDNVADEETNKAILEQIL